MPELNREIASLAVTGLRRSLAIFDYGVTDPNWEALLKQHDGANDLATLQDVFG